MTWATYFAFTGHNVNHVGELSYLTSLIAYTTRERDVLSEFLSIVLDIRL